MVDRKGITALIVNNRRLLLLKRIKVPFITHPGYWSFVTGAKKPGESYISAAYREISEETGIRKPELKVLLKNRIITIKDEGNGTRWTNRFFIFQSKTRAIKLNFEHSDFKWVGASELQNGHNIIISQISDGRSVLRLIKYWLAKG